jgi:hypothetical protein
MPSPSGVSTNMEDIVMTTATALNELPYFVLEGNNRDLKRQDLFIDVNGKCLMATKRKLV